MGRYPAERLESKYAWMRERQRKRQAKEVAVQAAPRHAEIPTPPAVRPELPRMLRIRQVAELLGMSRWTVRRVFRKHLVKVGGCTLIPEQAVRDAVRPH